MKFGGRAHLPTIYIALLGVHMAWGGAGVAIAMLSNALASELAWCTVRAPGALCGNQLRRAKYVAFQSYIRSVLAGSRGLDRSILPGGKSKQAVI